MGGAGDGVVVVGGFSSGSGMTRGTTLLEVGVGVGGAGGREALEELSWRLKKKL